MVSLFNKNDVIGDVEYNELFDRYNGQNYQNGGAGLHLGFGQLKTGEFYLIHGTQWQGSQDHAEIVSARRIVKEAIKSDNTSELEKYPELIELYENEFNKKTINQISKVFSLRINIRENEKETEEKLNQFINKIKSYKDLK